MRSLTGVDEVLKQDERGRVQVSRERREALLAEFEQSGMSGAKFARVAGLNYQTFAGWVRRKRRTGDQPGMVQFLEAVVGSPTESPSVARGGLEVELPGGSRLRVDSPGQLPLAAELISLVAQSGRSRC